MAARVRADTAAGFHRVSWNLRYPSKAVLAPGEQAGGKSGFLATAGTYTAALVRTSSGVETSLAGPVSFEVAPLYEPALEGAAPEEIIALRKELERLQGEMTIFSRALDGQLDRIAAMQTAHSRADRPEAGLVSRLHEARENLLALRVRATGYTISVLNCLTCYWHRGQPTYAAVQIIGRVPGARHHVRTDRDAPGVRRHQRQRAVSTSVRAGCLHPDRNGRS